MTASTTEAPVLGHGRMARKEDQRLVRGLGRFTDDLAPPGLAHLAILRAPVAHARIVRIDTTAALMHPKVLAVVTGAMLDERGIAWMPTLAGDRQAVLALDAVRFQGQEVAFVVAEDRYAARDALELIDVEYEALAPVVDARRALEPDSAIVRDDLGKTDNLCFEWETGDAVATEAAFRAADVVVRQEIVFPRVHPAPLETCAAVADWDRVAGKLTLWCTSQAPHIHRVLYAMFAGIPEHKIRVVSPDVGGGFGSKVPLYPGYVCAIAASIITGRPVKWAEDRTESLVAGAFARDYVMTGEIAATSDGRILAVRSHVLADQGAFNATAAPLRFPGGFFGVFTGSYAIEAAFCSMTAVYTTKAPGGVAYSCSFRIAEAVYLVERLVDLLARELAMDPVDLRRRNLIRPDQFPYTSRTGWVYDSGDYARTLDEMLRLAGYDDLRAEQAERRAAWAERRAVQAERRAQQAARGAAQADNPGDRLMGIGVSFFTEAVGAGPRTDMDMVGLAMSDACEVTVQPTGTAVVRLSVQTQGQGHETTFAQIVAEELGIHPDLIDVVHGDTDATPFGLGTYGSRSTPVSGAAAVIAARKIREKSRVIAAHLLGVAPADVVWSKLDGFSARALPSKQVTGDVTRLTMADIARCAYGGSLPDGLTGGLSELVTYDPPNLTYPCGAYLCVVEVDPATGEVAVRRFVAVDDCGTRINEMIVEGQVHRGLTDGVGIALMQQIAFDEHGTNLSASFMDYLLPTALEVPHWETGATYTPSPHHPIGAKGIGEASTVGSPPAIVNAIMDAFAPLGVRHADIPLTPSRVWESIQAVGQ